MSDTSLIEVELQKALDTLPICSWCEKHFNSDELHESANENGVDIYFCSEECESDFFEEESTQRSYFGDI